MGLGYICKINCEGICHYFFMTFRPSFLKEYSEGRIILDAHPRSLLIVG